MRNIFKIFTLAVALSVATGCTEKGEIEGGYGRLRISSKPSSAISLKSVATGDNIGTIEGLTLPEGDQFSIEITSLGDGTTQSWATLAEFGSEERYFLAGEYLLKAAYGNPELEGFDIAPAFAGEKQVMVKARKVSEAVISANILHSLVVVECGEQFNHYFTSAEFKLTTLAGGEFDIEVPMTSALFIRPQQFSIACSAVKQTGEVVELPLQIFTNVNPQTRYTVKYDVAQAGRATIEISLNNTLVGEVAIDNELNDEALPE